MLLAVTVGHAPPPTGIDVAERITTQRMTLRGVPGRRLRDGGEQHHVLLDPGRPDRDRLVSHRLPPSGAGHAVELFPGDAAKVLLVPDLGRIRRTPRGTGTDAE